MARISINNGLSTVNVETLTNGQLLTACECAANGGDAAYDEVDGQSFDGELAWLVAYCDAHERIYGAAWIAW